ncbi:hypothetical protein K0U83_23455 [bacterium]|nr:hypothetical protein [bacterium]
MIKIEFPADRPDIARQIGKALEAIAAGPLASRPDVVRKIAEDVNGPEDAPTFESAVGGAFGVHAEVLRPSEPEAEESTVLTYETPAPQTGRLLDGKCVPFNAAYCGESKDPFYTTGRQIGQWKKRRGVEQADYDTWYEGELGKVGAQAPSAGTATGPGSSTATSAHATAPFNTAAAFGAQPDAPAAEPAPTDVGALMVWISEKQASKLLTQEDVNAAYQVTGVSTADLFGAGATPHIAAIHTFLQAKV